MEEWKELYAKAVSFTRDKSSPPESINDLLIKDLNDEPLTSEEHQALQNYHVFKTSLLKSAKDDNDFSDKVKKLRIIANFTPWKEFLNQNSDL
ncbi:MAG: hypothetical protein D6799_00605 [Bacteroidetes bacterium]|nr:MAG: hypothetical protein D6799_00605 [Bacteroidota bacterium]